MAESTLDKFRREHGVLFEKLLDSEFTGLSTTRIMRCLDAAESVGELRPVIKDSLIFELEKSTSVGALSSADKMSLIFQLKYRDIFAKLLQNEYHGPRTLLIDQCLDAAESVGKLSPIDKKLLNFQLNYGDLCQKLLQNEYHGPRTPLIDQCLDDAESVGKLTSLEREAIDKFFGQKEFEGLRVKREERLNDLTRTIGDSNTTQYFEQLSSKLPHFPKNIQELQAYILNPLPPFKAVPNSDFFFRPCWQEFRQEMVEPTQSLQEECLLLLQTLNLCSTTIPKLSYKTELEMVGFLDPFLMIFSMGLKRESQRNQTSLSTSTKRPDFLQEGLSNIPIIIGEDKINNLRAAKNDLKSKIVWSEWGVFYGQAPYVIGLACSAGQQTYQVEVGLLLSTGEFVSLETFDLYRPFHRPRFTLLLLKLAPIVSRLDSIVGETCSNKYISMVRTPTTQFLSKKISTITAGGRHELEKTWVFRSEAELLEFQTRMSEIYSETNSPRLPFKNTKWESKTSSHTLIGRFYPFCQKVGSILIPDLRQFLSALVQICVQISLLQSLEIVHNDIRWDNVMFYQGQYLLIDFDDAYILKNSICPPLPELTLLSHSPRTSQQHGFEVDVWAIGFLILSTSEHFSFTVKLSEASVFGRLNQLAHRIQEESSKLDYQGFSSDKVMSVAEIGGALEEMLSNLENLEESQESNSGKKLRKEGDNGRGDRQEEPVS